MIVRLWAVETVRSDGRSKTRVFDSKDEAEAYAALVATMERDLKATVWEM